MAEKTPGTLKTIIGLISLVLPLLKVNPDLQTRKNLRQLRRTYKAVRKIVKKDGINPHEQSQLDEITDLMIEVAYQLTKKKRNKS